MDRTITEELVWIAAPSQLEEMVADLNRYTRLAVDTESNSLHAYKERVCLIQFSTDKKDYLVDPLAIKDLSPLGLILQILKSKKSFMLLNMTSFA
jgi:ribonuclease D